MSTEKRDTPGSRLRSYIDRRWLRRNGGITALAERIGVSRETVYEWFRDEREPNLDQLTRLAEALTESSSQPITRAQIVAAMDGGPPLLTLDEGTEELMRQIAERVLDERLGRR